MMVLDGEPPKNPSEYLTDEYCEEHGITTQKQWQTEFVKYDLEFEEFKQHCSFDPDENNGGKRTKPICNPMSMSLDPFCVEFTSSSTMMGCVKEALSKKIGVPERFITLLFTEHADRRDDVADEEEKTTGDEELDKVLKTRLENASATNDEM